MNDILIYLIFTEVIGIFKIITLIIILGIVIKKVRGGSDEKES